MNEGNSVNNIQNISATSVTPTPMPSSGNGVVSSQMPATPNTIQATPIQNAIQPPVQPQQVSVPIQPVVQPQQPVAQPQQVIQSTTPVQPVVQPQQVVTPQQTPFVQPATNSSNVVAPTQNVINTGKKRGGHLFLFIVIILIGLFIYFIDDVLAYFNQNFTPVVDTKADENGSANLIDGYIKINSGDSSYIKIKGIKFHSLKKGEDKAIFISYISDKTYSNSNSLNIAIELYNENKEKLLSEKFNVVGTIEAITLRQYKILVDNNTYDSTVYALVKIETNEGK
jgi:hypothetical protein